MDGPVKPIFLLADSQLLFWRRDDGALFLERLRGLLDTASPQAAYVGASNGDRPEFFELFRGAMAGIGVTDCRMIPSEPTDEDLRYFDRADVILLAGGDARRGWRVMKRNGIQRKVIERHYTGAVLMGVSAGAVQLGHHGVDEGEEGEVRLFDTFKLAPFLIDVHAEPDWARLKAALPAAEANVRGLAIPSGAGAILHPDLTLEAVRSPLTEFERDAEDGGEIRESLILPPGPEEEGVKEEAGEVN